MANLHFNQRSGLFLVLGVLLAVGCPRPSEAAADNLSWLPHAWGLWSYPRLVNRINAHGDEFNAAVLTTDEKNLVIGTEKGDILVWSISDRRIERCFHQAFPIHALALFTDPDKVVIAGGKHVGESESGSAGLLDLSTGATKELRGVGKGTIVHVAVDRSTGQIVTAGVAGRVTLWASPDQPPKARWDVKGFPLGLAVSGSTVYVTAIPVKDFGTITGETKSGEEEDFVNHILKLSVGHPERGAKPWGRVMSDGVWGSLSVSPNGRMLAATRTESGPQVMFLDLVAQKAVGEFEGMSAIWLGDDRAILFSWDAPSRLVEVGAQGVKVAKDFGKLEGFHGSGEPFGKVSWAVQRNAESAWGVFPEQSGVAQWNLPGKGKPEILTETPSLVYTMDVRRHTDGTGLIVTGGDDKYVRVWRLPDLSLQREFRVADGVPQGVALLGDGTHLVVSYGGREGSTEIVVADIFEGSQRKLLSVDQPGATILAHGENCLYPDGHQLVLASSSTGAPLRTFAMDFPVKKFALSSSGGQLAVADEKGNLAVFEVDSGHRLWNSTATVDHASGIAVTRDGRYVYTSEWNAQIKRWDTQSNRVDVLASHRGQCVALSLSADERYIVIGGDHADFMVFDAQTGDEVFHERTPDADFYVSNVWLDGLHLFFTTDAGLLVECLLPSAMLSPRPPSPDAK